MKGIHSEMKSGATLADIVKQVRTINNHWKNIEARNRPEELDKLTASYRCLIIQASIHDFINEKWECETTTDANKVQAIQLNLKPIIHDLAREAMEFGSYGTVTIVLGAKAEVWQTEENTDFQTFDWGDGNGLERTTPV